MIRAACVRDGYSHGLHRIDRSRAARGGKTSHDGDGEQQDGHAAED
jgi:hypothetical protein